MKCIISTYDNFVILAFRYTIAGNIAQDAAIYSKTEQSVLGKGCNVQSSHMKMWRGVQENVTRDLREIQKETQSKRLYVTGISLGGALASIAYVDLFFNKIFENIQMITYGAPKIGNKEWAAKFDQLNNGKTKRYYIKGDTIAFSPLNEPCLLNACSFRQVGTAIECDTDAKLCKQPVDIPDMSNSPIAKLTRSMRNFKEVIEMHLREEDALKNGIISHVNDYPLLYTYDVQISA